jgi:hypothetical protein
MHSQVPLVVQGQWDQVSELPSHHLSILDPLIQLSINLMLTPEALVLIDSLGNVNLELIAIDLIVHSHIHRVEILIRRLNHKADLNLRILDKYKIYNHHQ